jgi:hypothetical protein
MALAKAVNLVDPVQRQPDRRFLKAPCDLKASAKNKSGS